MYALKSFEARRQYPRRLKLLFDFLNLSGSVDQQALLFLENVQKNQPLQQNNLLRFFEFHIVRVRHMELATGTLRKRYRAIKLFCEMNDVTYIDSITGFRIIESIYVSNPCPILD